MTKTNNFKNVSVNNVAIQEFENTELGFKVRCIKNEDGSISMNAEDTIIGFGLIQKQIKKGKDISLSVGRHLTIIVRILVSPTSWGKTILYQKHYFIC